MQQNTSLRRKEKERKDATFISQVLAKAEEIYIAFNTDGAPYVIPLNFVYIEGKLYFHCAREGYKLECIQKNPKVGFSTAVDIKVLPEDATTLFKSIVGTGHMTYVEDTAEKGFALDALAIRYQAQCQIPAPASAIERTGILRLDIENICGKETLTSPKKA